MSDLALRISNILTFLLKRERITESELSRKIDIPRATINRLTSGTTPDPRASTLESIARYFDITIDQLLGNQPILNKNNTTTISNELVSIPIISWENTLHSKEILKKITPESHDDWIVTDLPIEKGDSFALKVKGDSMWPHFQEGTTIIINPNKEPKNRDFVILHINASDDILLRQLIIEGKYKFAKAINELFPVIELTEEDKILGCIIQARNDFN